MMDIKKIDNLKPVKKESLVEQIKDVRAFRKQFDDLMEMQENPPKRTFGEKLSGKNKPPKAFKDPRKMKAGAKRKLKQNYVVVVYIQDNGAVDIKQYPIINNLIFIPQKGTYHLVTSRYILRYNKYPMIIQPSWDSVPFDPKEHLLKTEEKGTKVDGQKLLIQIAKMAVISSSRPAGGKIIAWIIGIVVILGLVLSGMGVI